MMSSEADIAMFRLVPKNRKNSSPSLLNLQARTRMGRSARPGQWSLPTRTLIRCPGTKAVDLFQVFTRHHSGDLRPATLCLGISLLLLCCQSLHWDDPRRNSSPIHAGGSLKMDLSGSTGSVAVESKEGSGANVGVCNLSSILLISPVGLSRFSIPQYNDVVMSDQKKKLETYVFDLSSSSVPRGPQHRMWTIFPMHLSIDSSIFGVASSIDIWMLFRSHNGCGR